MQNSTLVKVLLSAAVVLGGVVFFAANGFGSSTEYMKVDQLIAKPDLSSYEGREIKVHGWVLGGSIHESVIQQQTIRTFVVQNLGKKIQVINRGPKPDTFNDQSEVVATGRLIPRANALETAKLLGVTIDTSVPYVLEATELQAKCPSKYDGAQINKDLKPGSFEPGT